MAKKVTVESLLEDEKFEETISKLSFEDGMMLLEELVSQIERGALPLEKAISSYERGVKIVSALKAKLDGAEASLKVISQ